MVEADSSFLKLLNILAFAVMVIVNGLAGSTTIIGGKNTAQISDANPTLITPAGYVFSIWGIIYILLGIFVFYQASPKQKVKEFREKVGYLFIASSVLNIVWIFLWQFEYLIFSVVVIFLLLATLIAIYLRLGIGKSTVPLREKIAFHAPFSVYLGWITIASIANVATALVSVNWDGFGISPETWATLIAVIALLITLLVVVTRKDLAYGLVVIWAFVGIAVKQGTNQTIATITEASAIIIAITIIIITLLSKLKR
ncbi:MAG: TspO/MBR family protein [Candidatus Bathyarchaeales archaeon]